MKKALLAVFIGLFFVGSIPAASGTPDEAKAMVQKAVAFLKANGKDKAFAEFNDPKGQFVDRDLYIFIIDLSPSTEGKCLAHGGNSRQINKDVIDFRDTDGVFFIKEIIKLAKAKGTGWVDYKWTNPVTKNIDPKSIYLEKIDDLVVACGFYKKGN